VFGAIKASSETAFRRLTARFVAFYRDQLFNHHWGEQVRFERGNIVRVAMVFQGLSQQHAENVWRPFLSWVAAAPHEFAWEMPPQVAALPARHLWDARFLRQNAPQLIVADDRPHAPESNFSWAGDRREAGQFLHGYRSAWLPASLLEKERQSALVDALFAGSRHWGISLHFNKGLAGAPAEELAAARDTAMNPVVLDAFALAIIAGNSPAVFPGIPGHEPDEAAARRNAAAINRAMDELSKVVPRPGSYVAESDFFEREWREAFWGANYPRLAAVKRRYDPAGLFVVHHGVGSEEWSADGFVRQAARRDALTRPPRGPGLEPAPTPIAISRAAR
jgi:FAD/FMN-containing dehydrogenase